MSRALSARQTELSERRALTPVPLLKLTTYTDREAKTGGVDRYFSDRPLQYDYGNTGTLRDFAPHVPPDCMQPRDLDEVRPGGLGTHFILQVMDEVGFVEPPPEGGGNLLRMVKKLD